jgi:hypothetical protein
MQHVFFMNVDRKVFEGAPVFCEEDLARFHRPGLGNPGPQALRSSALLGARLNVGLQRSADEARRDWSPSPDVCVRMSRSGGNNVTGCTNEKRKDGVKRGEAE